MHHLISAVKMCMSTCCKDYGDNQFHIQKSSLGLQLRIYSHLVQSNQLHAFIYRDSVIVHFLSDHESAFGEDEARRIRV